jgi:hypothetical protein
MTLSSGIHIRLHKASHFLRTAGKKRQNFQKVWRLKRYFFRGGGGGWGGNFTYLKSLYVFFIQWQKNCTLVLNPPNDCIHKGGLGTYAGEFKSVSHKIAK